MRKATIIVTRNADAALDEMGQRFVRAWKTGKSDEDVLRFESPTALFRVLTPRRWELLERLQQIGATSIRGLARELERDVHRVHEDVHALKERGLVEDTDDGKVHVPYDVIRTEFELTSAA
jgi:predicted transcriptional regulator